MKRESERPRVMVGEGNVISKLAIGLQKIAYYSKKIQKIHLKLNQKGKMREAHAQYLDECEVCLNQMIEKLQNQSLTQSSTALSTIGNGYLNST